MTRIATTTGLFPIPDDVKHELRSTKGRQKEDLIDGHEGPAVRDIYARARQEVIDWQQEAGLDRIVEGQLRWDDMLCHPLAVHPNVETGGLRRYYENNNFYREMSVTDRLTPHGDIQAELDRATESVDRESLQAVIPGPASLAELATDEHYGDPDTFIAGISSFLAEEVETFPATALFILEPSLAGPAPDSLGAVIEGLEQIANSADTAGIEEVVVHTYWGAPAEDTYEALRNVDTVGMGYDLVSDPAAVHELVDTHGAPANVALGVVDGQNTRIEGRDEIEASISSFLEVAGTLDRLYLVPNTEGFYLPTNRFMEKLAVLADAAVSEVSA